MTKQELIKSLSEKLGCSKTEADNFLTAFSELVRKAYVEEDSISIGDLGSFKVKHTKARKAINPRTKESVDVPAKKKLNFIPVPELRG